MKKLLMALAVAMVAAVTYAAESSAGAGELRLMADTYLEADGSQAIDTEYKICSKTRIVADISYDMPSTGTRTLYGVVDSDRTDYVYAQNSVAALVAANNGKWSGTGGGDYQRFGTRYLHDYDLKSGKWRIYAGSAQVAVATVDLVAGEKRASLPMYIFNKNPISGGMGPTQMRVYSLKIYEDDVLVRDFVPYGLGTLTGLVDRCSGKVHTDVRKSATPFKIGTDDACLVSSRDNPIWVDTGYKVNANTKIEVDFAFDQATSQGRVFGAGGGEGIWCSLYASGDSNTKSGWKLSHGCKEGELGGDTIKMTGGGSEITVDGRRYNYVLDIAGNRETLTCGTKVFHDAGLDNVVTKSATVPLGIFAYPRSDASGNVSADGQIWNSSCYGSVKIYSFKIWDNGVLVHDYKPRLQDNVAGFWDSKTEKFLTASGLGQLGWGGAIEAVTSGDGGGDAYLLSHGNEVVDTGCRLTSSAKFVLDYSWYNLDNTAYACGIYPSGDSLNCGGIAVYRQGVWNTFVSSKGDGTQSWGGSGSGDLTPTKDRSTLTIDVPGQLVSWSRNGVEVGRRTIPCLLQDGGDANFAVFGYSSGGLKTGNPTYAGASRLKLYSLLVYEDGVLQHEFVPAKENGVVGLKDLKTDNFITKAVGTSNLEFFFGGYAGQGLAFSKQPSGCTIELKGSSTLSAFAPGATFYQWFKNGALVEGATSPTLQVDWRKGLPREDVYQCVAHYPVFGYVASEKVTVANQASGLFIVVK